MEINCVHPCVVNLYLQTVFFSSLFNKQNEKCEEKGIKPSDPDVVS